MKGFIKNERGVSLISLAAAIIILGIITSMLIYNIKDTKDMERLTNMYTDIENITDRISNYYSKYGALPIKNEIDLSSDPTITKWKTDKSENKGPLGANDSDTFYVINLNALENLTLNYGKGFYNMENSVPADKDIYVINENSHNIYYLNGIKVRGNSETKIYYTNLDRDSEKVVLNYIDGIRIPSGFSFKSGTTKNDLKIENSGHDEYIWANTVDGTYTVDFSGSNATLTQTVSLTDTTYTVDLLTGQSKEDLIKSNNEFGGFYYTIVDSSTINVYYLSVAESDNWGPTYDVEGIYKDKNGDTAYIPAGFKISRLSTLNTIKNGLVIKNNSTGDEYVWIDVPDGILENCHTLEEVENALKEYTNNYRENGYEDIYEGDFVLMTDNPNENSKSIYNELKNKMLQSIKENGGFYIGRYGASKSNDNKPLSQRDKKVWADITIKDAQIAANALTSENYTYSLMFGLQWDLVCKFIENTGAKTYHEIAEDSKEWGNYKNSQFIITSNNAQKRTSNGISSIEKGETKNSGVWMLLTTAASEQNKAINLYDFNGNVWELTLENYTSETTQKCVARGGEFYRESGINGSASFRVYNTTDFVNFGVGFRVALFK